MEAVYKQYLEGLYSSSPWSEFIGFYEASNPALTPHSIIYGSGGFGNIGRSPNLMIFDENPPDLTLEWMTSCIDTVGIRDECYIYVRSGPWAHLKILDKREWLTSLWGMPFPQTDDTVRSLLMLSMDQTQALYFAEREGPVEVYIGSLAT